MKGGHAGKGKRDDRERGENSPVIRLVLLSSNEDRAPRGGPHLGSVITSLHSSHRGIPGEQVTSVVVSNGHVAWLTTSGNIARIKGVGTSGSQVKTEILRAPHKSGPRGAKGIGALRSELLIVDQAGGLYSWNWNEAKCKIHGAVERLGLTGVVDRPDKVQRVSTSSDLRASCLMESGKVSLYDSTHAEPHHIATLR